VVKAAVLRSAGAFLTWRLHCRWDGKAGNTDGTASVRTDIVQFSATWLLVSDEGVECREHAVCCSLLHDYWYLTKVWSVESTQSVVLCHSLLIAGDLAALKINQMQPAECFHSRQCATCAIPAANVESPTSTVANWSEIPWHLWKGNWAWWQTVVGCNTHFSPLEMNIIFAGY